MRIAICEDEEFIQNSIEKNVEKCLEITGMAGKCECFVSAEELLEKGNMPYALYILDVEMKKLSGLELAEHIRKIKKIQTMVIDIEKKGFMKMDLAKRLAETLGSTYYPMDTLQANDLLAMVAKERS